MKKYIAELFSTFILSLLVALSVSGQFPIPTPILAALCVTVFVYTIGNISGAHINPAVTIGLLALKKIKLDEAVKYIMIQFFGAMLATGLLNIIQTESLNSISAGGGTEFMAEMIGTGLLTFGIASVAFGTAPGYIVGGSLLLGISIAVLVGSAGILNPAVGLALGAFHPTYIIGQIIGSVLGFSLHQYLNKPTLLKKKSN